ncbi:MAG: N-acyl homoserine lactonase family protein [Candidatus Acidiferrales bacterium]
MKPTVRVSLIVLFLCSCVVALGHFAHANPRGQTGAAEPEYRIRAIRYATVHDFPLSDLVIGALGDKKIDVAMIVWLIQGGGHTILFDSGFHLDRVKSLDEFHIADYLRPDEAVKLAGVDPAAVTDVIISHAHWDHLDGIDLFPKATIWIQKAEFEYYTGAAWQPGGQNGGIYPEDAIELVRRNTLGQVRLVNGDDALSLPGIRAYTGSRHTYASQYIRVAGNPTFVLASDNCYLYENLRQHRASATFEPADEPGNIAQQTRMISLAGSVDRVVPGHDPEEFVKFPTTGRIARIKD